MRLRYLLFIGFVIGFLVAVALDTTSGAQASQKGLKAVVSYGMQPFGISQEDNDTAQLHVQPTYSPQVTRHYYFLQGSLNQ